MKYASLSISIVLTAIVFSMSMVSGETSGSLSLQVSQFILDLLDKVFPANKIDIEALHPVIRKSAHMFEYMVLGISWFYTIKTLRLSYLRLMILGLLIASTDELIQSFSPDRGASVIDVIVFDFLPFVLITGIFTLLTNRKVGEEDVMVTQTLTELADNHITPEAAYKKLYRKKPKSILPFTRKAHFVKLRITIPGEKGVNKLLRVLFFMPMPIFLIRFILMFVKIDEMEQVPLSKQEIVDLIASKNIKVNVTTTSGEKVLIKTI